MDNPLRIIFGLGISLKYWILSKIAPGIILIFWENVSGPSGAEYISFVPSTLARSYLFFPGKTGPGFFGPVPGRKSPFLVVFLVIFGSFLKKKNRKPPS